VSLDIIYGSVLVGVDPLILVVPLVHEQADRAFDQLKQVALLDIGVDSVYLIVKAREYPRLLVPSFRMFVSILCEDNLVEADQLVPR